MFEISEPPPTAMDRRAVRKRSTKGTSPTEYVYRYDCP